MSRRGGDVPRDWARVEHALRNVLDAVVQNGYALRRLAERLPADLAKEVVEIATDEAQLVEDARALLEGGGDRPRPAG